jgi:hypothetical protein
MAASAFAIKSSRLMQRLFLIMGGVLVVIGLAWPWLSKLPFGRLPGDINLERDGFGFHFPVVTSIVVSLLLSLLLWLFRR